MSAIRGPISYQCLEIFDINVIEEILNELNRMRWIFYDESKKEIKFHPIIKEYCYKQSNCVCFNNIDKYDFVIWKNK